MANFRMFHNIHIRVILALLFSVSSLAQQDAMYQVRLRLKLPAAMNWSDANPCRWDHITCDYDNQVTGIHLNNLGLAGTLSRAITNLTNLEKLELMHNDIEGSLPSMKGLTFLQVLNLRNNQFSYIPDDFFDGLNDLQEVYLDYNPFDMWSIPEGLTACISLKNFSAISANVGGTIPDIFSSPNFPNMINLHLSYNNLTGSLPSSFSDFMVQSLRLSGQYSYGSGGLNGSIGILRNMTQLVQLWLDMNAFSGPIPDLSELIFLEDLNLGDNSLSGPVPVSFTKLPSLKLVNFSNNALQGPTPKFPDSVSSHLSGNCFCLSSPGMECDSRVNTLVSILDPFGYPPKFSESWTFNDPCDLWVGIGCTDNNISSIILSYKSLAGTISPKFAALTSIRVLVLSHNNITGTIPEALTRMPNLKLLDLSFNKLHGEVPRFPHTKVIVEGNVDIGKHSSEDHPPSTRATHGKGSKLGLLVGSVMGSLALIVVAVLLLFFFFRR